MALLERLFQISWGNSQTYIHDQRCWSSTPAIPETDQNKRSFSQWKQLVKIALSWYKQGIWKMDDAYLKLGTDTDPADDLLWRTDRGDSETITLKPCDTDFWTPSSISRSPPNALVVTLIFRRGPPYRYSRRWCQVNELRKQSQSNRSFCMNFSTFKFISVSVLLR